MDFVLQYVIHNIPFMDQEKIFLENENVKSAVQHIKYIKNVRDSVLIFVDQEVQIEEIIKNIV